MDTEILQKTVKGMLAQKKGILAADESNGTADKRLASVEIEGGEENRRRYRDLFLATPKMEEYVNGVILYDETLRQNTLDGTPFTELLQKKNVLIGIKVDEGRDDYGGEGESITKGLEGLPERVKEYFSMGARFAKWRAATVIGEETPTREVTEINSERMAKYSKICQEAGLVPIVEPEVLLNGEHTIEKCEEVTEEVLRTLFSFLEKENVFLPGLVLKTSMVLPGDKSGQEVDSEIIAQKTIDVLKMTVPEDVGGVVFLSGGQEPQEATKHLNDIAELEPLPWEITFSYARAIQGPALEIWKGKEENVEEARKEFIHRLKLNSLADQGKYKENLE